MAKQPDVPDGAAVLPLIPAEVGAHPLLLAVLHAAVFLDGSQPDVVHADAASEALEYMATYLQRLSGKDLQRVKEDLECLHSFAKEDGWSKEGIEFLKGFLASYGVEKDR